METAKDYKNRTRKSLHQIIAISNQIEEMKERMIALQIEEQKIADQIEQKKKCVREACESLMHFPPFNFIANSTVYSVNGNFEISQLDAEYRLEP